MEQELFDPLTLVAGRATLDEVRQAAADCRACHLWKCGTQTVFGEGPGRATAAQDFFGRSFRVMKQRGEALEAELHPRVVAAVHPSSILRTPDDKRDEARAAFVADLHTVARLLR
jgi:uracil-DNA glycosylase